MSLSRLGPHVLNPTAPALAWSRRANVVKAVGDTQVLHVAPPHAMRIYRWPWSEVEQDRILDTGNAGEVVDKIVNGLGGYRHDRLAVELLNEVHRDRTAAYIALATAVVPMLKVQGLKVAVPSWSTGAWEQEHWDAWRAAGWASADLIALHAYFSKSGFSIWHALRYRQFWRPGDPPIVITECGIDDV